LPKLEAGERLVEVEMKAVWFFIEAVQIAQVCTAGVF